MTTNQKDLSKILAEYEYKKSPSYAIKQLIEYLDEQELKRKKTTRLNIVLSGIAACTSAAALLHNFFK